MQSDAEKPEHPSEVIVKNRHKNKQPFKSCVFYTVHFKTDSDASQFTVLYLLDWMMQQESMLHELFRPVHFFHIIRKFQFFLFIWVLFLACSIRLPQCTVTLKQSSHASGEDWVLLFVCRKMWSSYLRPDWQPELTHGLWARVLAAIIIHGPRTPKREACTTRVWVKSLARTSPGFIGSTSSCGWKTVSVQFVS